MFIRFKKNDVLRTYIMEIRLFVLFLFYRILVHDVPNGPVTSLTCCDLFLGHSHGLGFCWTHGQWVIVHLRVDFFSRPYHTPPHPTTTCFSSISSIQTHPSSNNSFFGKPSFTTRELVPFLALKLSFHPLNKFLG